MAVSKRLRFEIFRRDNHACRYCGAKAPDVQLVIDHVVPEALGGRSVPENLVTACDSCNGGKTSTSPDEHLVGDVAEDALRWSQAIKVAADQMLADLHASAVIHDQFDMKWSSWTAAGEPLPRPDGWRASIDSILATGLPLAVLFNAVDRAMGYPKLIHEHAFRYMCGIAWARVTELQAAAHQSMEPQAPSSGPEDDCGCNGAGDLGVSILDNLTNQERQAALLAVAALDRRTYEDDVAQAALCAVHEMQRQTAELEIAVHQFVSSLPPTLAERVVKRAWNEAEATRGGATTDADVAAWCLQVLADPNQYPIETVTV